MRVWSLFVICAIGFSLIGCSREPAYSNINVNRSAEPSAATDQAANVEPGAAIPPAAQPAQPAPIPGAALDSTSAPTPPANPKVPAFVDQVHGGIKDLPAYPGAQLMNAQYGPAQGVESASMVYVCGDPMDKIIAFYKNAAQKTKWVVASDRMDGDSYQLDLKKGTNDEAAVRITREPNNAKLTIVVVRATKMMPEPGK